MTRAVAVAVMLALTLAACGGSESDAIPAASGSSTSAGHPPGYVLSGCSVTCYFGSGGGTNTDSSCASGRSYRAPCSAAPYRKCDSYNSCTTCYSERWICQ
jgi:hypothetical protein